MTHLNDLSKVYLESIASQETQEEGYKPIDKKKENKMYRRAGNLARTGLSSRGKKKEDALNKSDKIVTAISRQKEKERFAKMGDEKARDNYKEEVEIEEKKSYSAKEARKGKDIGKKGKNFEKIAQSAGERYGSKEAGERVAGAVLAKLRKEELDPVGQEDKDIDNDGDHDKTDKYLLNRRKKVGKAIAKKKGMKEEEERIGGGNLEKLAKKASKRIDADNDGDVDMDDPKEKGMGEFVPSADGKKKVRTSVQTEGFSNWRQDLTEVMTDTEADEKITEKKVKNTIKINPKLGEAVEEMGGTLIEEIEIDEMDYIIESVYDELIEEGYSEDDVEDAIEFALTEDLNEASDRYYDSAVKASKKAGAKIKRAEMMKKAKGRLRFMKRKAGEKLGAAKKKVGMASAKAQVAAYNKGREVAQTAGDKTRKAKQAVADAPKKAKKGLKGMIKKAAQKVVDRMSEEVIAEMNAGPSTPVKNYDGKIMPNAGAGRIGKVRLKPGVAPVKTADSYEPEGDDLQELDLVKGVQGALDKGAKFMKKNPVGKAVSDVLKPVGSGRGTARPAPGARPGTAGGGATTRPMMNSYEPEGQLVDEEASDAMKDRRMERGGVDGNTRYDKPAKNAPSAKKKKYDGMSVLDMVKADIRKKHGKGAIMDTKKK